MNPQFRSWLRYGERLGMRYALNLPRHTGAFRAGALMGRNAGASIDFRDYRDYQPGDDPRWVDWSVYGRSDRLVVKLFHEEVSPHLDLLLDGSRSMALPGSAKAECTLGLAAALATAAAAAHCTHRIHLARDGCDEIENAARPPGLWNGIDFEAKTPLAQAVEHRPPRFRRRSIRILISDLLWPGDPRNLLRRFADSAAAVAVIRIFAREDQTPPERGNIRLLDFETGEVLEIFIDAVAERRYREACERHRAQWERACREIGAQFIEIIAEDVAASDPWDLSPLQRAGILL